MKSLRGELRRADWGAKANDARITPRRKAVLAGRAISTATLMVAFVAGWAVSDSQARVAPGASVQVDTFEMMTNAK